jgi:hypothetical protein
MWQSFGQPTQTLFKYDIAAYLQYDPRRRVIEAFNLPKANSKLSERPNN